MMACRRRPTFSSTLTTTCARKFPLDSYIDVCLYIYQREALTEWQESFPPSSSWRSFRAWPT